MRLIPWMRGDRTAALSALALAAGGREALPEAFTRLAAEDPLLRPWIARLVPGLRAGKPLAEVLRRARALDRDEAAELAVAADPAEALGRLAAGSGQAPPGYLFVRWYPVWMFTVAIAVAWLGKVTVLGWLISHWIELGIKLPGLTLLALRMAEDGWLWLLLAWSVATVVACIPGLRHLLHLWSPAVHRQAAWWRLVRMVRRFDAAEEITWWQHWRVARDWSTWWTLSRWRLPPDLRMHLRRLSLRERLHVLGMPAAAATDHPDWIDIEASAHRRLSAALAASWVRGTWRIQLLFIVAAVTVACLLPPMNLFYWY